MYMGTVHRQEQFTVVSVAVYTLWKCSELLPSASTGPYVFTKLQGGADLMLPGVVLPRSKVPELKGVEKGQLCSINLVGNRYSV